MDGNHAAMTMLRLTISAAFVASFMGSALAAAPAVPAPSRVVAQLRAMNDADCAASKRGDTKAWIATLAPEYVTIEATGTRSTYKDLVGGEDQPSQTTITGCGTKVTSVTRVGEHYYLYGEYVEEGIIRKSQRRFRIAERIRDSWRRIDGRWKQTQSLAYEYTAWVDGKQVSHHVLSAKAIEEAG